MNIPKKRSARIIEFMFAAIRWIFLAFIIVACQPDGPFPFYTIPEAVKPYVLFPEGSYWVYEEIGDHRMDSVFRYSVETKSKNAVQRLGYKYEELLIKHNRSLTKDSVVGFGQPAHGDESKWWYQETGLEELGDWVPIFIYPMEITENANFARGTIEYAEYHESMTLNGQVFAEVMVFAVNIGREPQLTARVFHAKNAGVIRKELTDGSIWELKRYFINR